VERAAHICGHRLVGGYLTTALRGGFFVAIEGDEIVEQYQWLVNTGFAAVVAWYVLTRLEPSIRQLERTVNLLAIVVAKSSGIDYDEVRREYQGYDQGR